MPCPGHKHQWYAISFDEHTHKPVLFACAVYWGCIATTMPQLKGRGRNRALVNPEPIVPMPKRGMWAITEKEPTLAEANEPRSTGTRAPIPRRTLYPDARRGRSTYRAADQGQADGARHRTTQPDPRPDEPASTVAEQQLPTLHPWAD